MSTNIKKTVACDVLARTTSSDYPEESGSMAEFFKQGDGKYLLHRKYWKGHAYIPGEKIKIYREDKIRLSPERASKILNAIEKAHIPRITPDSPMRFYDAPSWNIELMIGKASGKYHPYSYDSTLLEEFRDLSRIHSMLFSEAGELAPPMKSGDGPTLQEIIRDEKAHSSSMVELARQALKMEEELWK